MWFRGLYPYRIWVPFITLFPNNVFLSLLHEGPTQVWRDAGWDLKSRRDAGYKGNKKRDAG